VSESVREKESARESERKREIERIGGRESESIWVYIAGE